MVSFSQKLQMNCPETSRSFEFEVWTIIDRDEHPDLIEKTKAGKLHTIISPFTGNVIDEVIAPILIFQPQLHPPVFYSPSDYVTEDVALEQADVLIQQLENKLNGDWQERWIEDGLPIVYRSFLSYALRNFQHAQGMMQLQSLPQIELDKSAQLMLEFVQLPSNLDTLHQRIELLKEVIEYAGGDQPHVAGLYSDLGTYYLEMPTGDHAQNIELAIDALQNALKLVTKEEMPVEWAKSMTNLANVYQHRIYGDHSDNIEIALNMCRQALIVYKEKNKPDDWSRTMSTLASVYLDRVKGDRSQSIESAIDACNQALTVRTKSELPLEWATTSITLANAYVERLYGSTDENIESAIDLYRQVLRIFPKRNTPMIWANAMNNLANALIKRLSGSHSKNIERAIENYEKVLSVYTIDKMPLDWARTMMNLATAHSHLSRIRKHNGHFVSAITAYEAALTVITKKKMPNDWASIMMNLAIAYQENLRTNDTLNVEKAINLYKEVLSVRTREEFPIEYRNIMINLAQIYFDQEKWTETYEACKEAIGAGNEILANVVSDVGRIDLIQYTYQLHSQAAYSALKLDNYDDAFTQLESGKTTIMADTIALNNMSFASSEENNRNRSITQHDHLQSFQQLQQENLERQNDDVSNTINTELQDEQNGSHDTITNIMLKNFSQDYEMSTVSDLLSLIPQDEALVALLFTTKGSAVFTIPSGVNAITAEHVIMLDSFRLEDLRAISRAQDDDPGWLRYYMMYRLTENSKVLFEAIDSVLPRLWTAFVEAIHNKLQSLSVRRILLLPQGDTNLLPLHIAWREVDGVRRFLMDDYNITYTFSLRMIANTQRNSHFIDGAFVAGVSKYNELPDLPNTRLEAESIAELFNVEPVLDEEVSISTIKANVPGKAFVHISCHGGYGWKNNPFESALYVNNDEKLTLHEIISDINSEKAQLIVLSACETGFVDFKNIPDEFIGLQTGFIQTGARAVISSLWSVDDVSTVFLMNRMYTYILDKLNPLEPAQALREAQLWLRSATTKQIAEANPKYLIKLFRKYELDEKPYAHPYYWAAFVYHGA